MTAAAHFKPPGTFPPNFRPTRPPTRSRCLRILLRSANLKRLPRDSGIPPSPWHLPRPQKRNFNNGFRHAWPRNFSCPAVGTFVVSSPSPSVAAITSVIILCTVSVNNDETVSRRILGYSRIRQIKTIFSSRFRFSTNSSQPTVERVIKSKKGKKNASVPSLFVKVRRLSVKRIIFFFF